MSTPGAEPSVWTVVAANAADRPERTALSWGGRLRKGSLTSAELLSEAERLAGVLSEHAAPGDSVLLRTGNHAGAALVWLAAVRARLVPCLVNWTTDDRIAQSIADAIGATLIGRAEGSPGADPLDGIAVEGPSGPIDLRGAGTLRSEPEPDDLLEVSTTSGTTGTPKALWFTHRAHLASRRAWIEHLGLGPDDVVLTFMPLAHASGSRNSYLAALVAGARCHLVEEFEPETFWDVATEEQATFFMFHEPSAEALVATAPGPADRAHPVRLACGAGGIELIETFEGRFGVRTLQNYGLSETGTVTSPSPSVAEGELASLRRFSGDGTYVGKQFGESTIVELRKPDGSTVTEQGESGEFWITTPFACITDPGDDRAALRWLASGDLGVLGPGSSLHYVGRSNDIVDRQGVRVRLVDVENLARRLPGIADAGAVVVDGRLRLAVAGEAGGPADSGAVEALIGASLPASHRPDEIVLVDTVPRNAMGRVQRALLR